MIKAEWGAKRSCPKCATRFYDLTKDDPVTCINCGYAWIPESVLKSKQPMPFEMATTNEKAKKDNSSSSDDDDDLAIDEDEEPSADDEVDLTTDDDDLGVSKGDDDDDN